MSKQPSGAPPAFSQEATAGMSIDEFTSLASRLANLGLYREAIRLYETATHLHPSNIALKINLARVRDMKRRADIDVLREFDGDIKALRAREDRLANQYTGLAELHFRRGDYERAKSYFEFAQRRNETLYEPLYYLARIALEGGDRDRAIRLLEEARHANPFAEDAVALLGQLYMERGDGDQALLAYLDAVVLAGDTEGERPAEYNQKLRTLAQRLGRGGRIDLPALVRERTARFTGLAEKLEQRRREALQEHHTERLQTIFAQYTARPKKTEAEPLVDVSPYRKYGLFGTLDDASLLKLVKRMRRLEIGGEDPVFSEGEDTGALYLVESGAVRVRKMTPLGEHLLSSFAPGDVFGEMNFLDGRPHSADAVANEPSAVLVLAHSEIDSVLVENKHIAVQIYSYFWRTLAQRIRETNEKMKSFFSHEATLAGLPSQEQLAEAEKVIVDIDKKIALFREKGLSGHDLELLASLSSEELYNRNDLIFQEGDEGAKLYIVLDGKVRISKTIPGVGEEALSILECGDFFGEMALVDNKPRSADARAHEDRTTVVSIDKSALEDILAADAATAVQFLAILCRILAQRLREINETIVKWRIMSGGFW